MEKSTYLALGAIVLGAGYASSASSRRKDWFA
jgi:hypothetical protein